MSRHLQAVIVDCPYETFSQPKAGRLFLNSMELRIRGYQGAFGQRVFPLESNDFIATHTLVCEEREGDLYAIMTYKTVSLKRSQAYGLPFPVTALANSLKIPSYLNYAQKIVSEAQESGQDLLYHGAWTSDPSIRADSRDLALQLRELMGALSTYQGLQGPRSRAISAGNIRFKADRFISALGYRVPELNGVPLPPFDVTYSAEPESALLLQNDEFSPYALGLVEKYRDICESALRFSTTAPDTAEKLAA